MLVNRQRQPLDSKRQRHVESEISKFLEIAHLPGRNQPPDEPALGEDIRTIAPMLLKQLAGIEVNKCCAAAHRPLHHVFRAAGAVAPGGVPQRDED